jgi:hypothetical protein
MSGSHFPAPGLELIFDRTGRLGMLPAAAFYVLIVYLSQ